MSYFQFYQPFSGVVPHLIIINVLMFIGTYVILGQEHYDRMIGEYDVLGRLQWWELEQSGIAPTTWNGPMLGASGAIFGIYVAFAYLFPNQIISLLFPPVSLKAKYFVPIMAGLELFYGVRGYSTGIAHFAHLGGALFGFLLILYWRKYGSRL